MSDPLIHRQLLLRDGIQDIRTPRDVDGIITPIPTAIKLQALDELITKGGEKYVEIGSLVGRSVVQMQDSEAVIRAIAEKIKQGQYKGVTFAVLAVNQQGVDRFVNIVNTLPLSHQQKQQFELAINIGMGDTFRKENMGRNSLEEDISFVEAAAAQMHKKDFLPPRVYLSTIFEDMNGKAISPDKTAQVTRRLLQESGVQEIALSDTTGVGTPGQMQTLMKSLLDEGVNLDHVAMHLHGTPKNALANLKVYLANGGRKVDSTPGGTGGCPTVKGRPAEQKNNLPTEELLAYCAEYHIPVGSLNADAIIHAAHPVLMHAQQPPRTDTYQKIAMRDHMPPIAEHTPPVRVERHRLFSNGYFRLNINMKNPGILEVALARPDKRNAFDAGMIDDITRLFKSIDVEKQLFGRPIKAVVLSGEQSCFCAGADLGYMEEIGKSGKNLEAARELAEMFDAVRTCPVPVIARANGKVMAGGIGLAAACDYVVGQTDDKQVGEPIKLAFSEVNLRFKKGGTKGLRPSTISPHCIGDWDEKAQDYGRLGITNAQHLFSTGASFTAEDAKKYGLFDEVVPLDQMDKQIDNVLRQAVSMDKQAFRNQARKARLAHRQTIPGIVPSQPPEMVTLVSDVAGLLKTNNWAGLKDRTAHDIAKAREDAMAEIVAVTGGGAEGPGDMPRAKAVASRW